MPRRKNQSPNTAISGRDSTENMAQNSDVQKKWRDTQLHDLQSMFAGSIDPEVVQLVLSESNYNVNDAVEKLFVLSGIEQGQTVSKVSQDNAPSTSLVSESLDSMLAKRQKPNYHDEISTSDPSDLVVDSNFAESHIGPTVAASAPSTFGNLPNHSSSSVTSKDVTKSSLVYNTAGTQHRTEVPRTLPPFMLPSSPLYSKSKNRQVTMTPDLYVNSTSPVMSSGIPDFPDNISQQYNTLKNQAKGAGSAERLFSQEPPGHNNLLYNTNTRPPFVQKVPGHFEFGRPPDVTLHDREQDLKGNFLKQVFSGSASTEDWKKVSQTSNTEMKDLDLELSKNGTHNQSYPAAHNSANKTQVPYNESQRTLKSDKPIQTNNQNSFSSPSGTIQKTFPTHNANKPHLQQKAKAVNQLPIQSSFHTLPKESILQAPPPVQRQFQPFVPPQGFGQTIPGNMSQPRFGLLPTPRSPWQQGPVVQRPMSAGRMPYQYSQGTFPFRPHPTFGRAAARPARQSFGVAVPFIPTIHQKLLIVIRGLPGSGKSSLAQRLKGVHGVVFSTDDYFYRNQKYEFDVILLGEAHEWNQKRAKNALENLQSPVIIDNTNTQAWEMKPYVSMALKHGYHIKVVEPDTSWKWNVKELARRNQHGVSIEALIRMKERYEHGITVEKIMNSERKLDAEKTGNKSETGKGTGAYIQNASPRPQSSPQERGSKELGTRKAESCGVPSRGKTTTKIEESDGISSLQVIEGQNNLEAKQEEFQGLSNSSEKGVSLVGKSDGDAENEGKKESRPYVVQAIDIGEFGDGEGGAITEETDSNSCPKPQRVQRVRERKSPNRQHEQQQKQQQQQQQQQTQQQHSDLSTLVCEETFTTCDGHDELGLNSTSSQGNAPKEDSTAAFRVEKLSTLASLANSHVASPAVSSSGSTEDSHVGDEVTPEMPKSSTVSPLSETLSADSTSPVLNASLVEYDGEGNEERSDFSKEESNEGKFTPDVEFLDRKTFLPLALEDDVTDVIADSKNDAVKHREPFGSNSSRTPPPLSALLASASRTKLKSRSRSNSDPTQRITDLVQSPVESSLKLLAEPNQAGRVLELNESTQSVFDEAPTQETNNPAEDVFSDAQNLSNLSDSLETSSSGDVHNDMTSGVEFLKTCFPDVDSELMNALLTSNSGNVMKVVDELLATERTEQNAEETEAPEQGALSNELPTFPDALFLPSQNRLIHAPNEEKNSLVPTEEKVEVVVPAGGFDQQTTHTDINVEISSITSLQENRPSHPSNLGPRPMAQTQSPSRRNAATFQLALEPAVALHLVEMFGSFAGVDFRENISPEDLIIDVDSSLARQLYKKWERSIQIRKGIHAARGGSQRTKREPTGNDSIHLSRDQAPSNSQRSPSRLRNESQAGNLRDIMDEQLALELSRNIPDVTEQDIATKVKRQKLYEMFPGIDPVALEEVFQANRYELAPSVEAVKESCNLHHREVPNTVIASGFSGRVANQEEATRKEAEEDWSWLYMDDSSQPKSEEASFQTLEEPSYLDYRAEAFQHHKQRDECFKKAAVAFSNKQGQLAQFYAQQGHMHTQKIKEANARAAALILNQKNELTDENTIDLHGLHVTEAIEALENMLMKRTDPYGGQTRRGCNVISVVTGRGNHSRGGKARIKPAILEYLKKNNYRFTEPHAGLVKVYL